MDILHYLSVAYQSTSGWSLFAFLLLLWGLYFWARSIYLRRQISQAIRVLNPVDEVDLDNINTGLSAMDKLAESYRRIWLRLGFTAVLLHLLGKGLSLVDWDSVIWLMTHGV